MKSILEEVLEITGGDRRQSYGHPKPHLSAIATLWSTYLQRRGILTLFDKLSASDVALMMVLLKVDREANSHKRDNLVDIAGWAWAASECIEEPKGKYIEINPEDNIVEKLNGC